MNTQVDNICVDLDGTLVNTDTLVESILLFIKQNPVNILKCIAWLWLGKARFKDKIASEVQLNVQTLPYNTKLLVYLQQECINKKIHLCTAANHSIAAPIAKHLGIFSSVFASSADRNLKGVKKAEVLVNEFGEKGFVYAGEIGLWESL